MNTLRWIVWKDLARFAADRNGAFLTILTPVAMAALLSVLFAPKEKATEVELLVADLDQSVASAALVKAIDDADALKVVQVDLEEARHRLERGKASVALVLPKGAGEQLSASKLFSGGKSLSLPLLYDPADGVEAGLAEGLVTKAVMTHLAQAFTDPEQMRSMLDGARTSINLAKATGLWDGPEGLPKVLDDAVKVMDDEVLKPGKAAPGGGLKLPVQVAKEKVVAAGPGASYNSYAHNFAGMLCMFILFAGVERGKLLVEEREGGSLQRLQVSPASRSSILLGSALSTLAIGLVISVAIYAVAMLVFGVRVLGSWPGFVLVVLAQASFVAGFGLFLSGIGRTSAQISSMGTFPVLVMSFLGGAWMPSFVLPDWVQSISVAVPTYWATRGLAAMTWRGLPFADALLPALVLFGMAAALAGIGLRKFRWG